MLNVYAINSIKKIVISAPKKNFTLEIMILMNSLNGCGKIPLLLFIALFVATIYIPLRKEPIIVPTNISVVNLESEHNERKASSVIEFDNSMLVIS